MWVTSNRFIAVMSRDVHRDPPPPEQPYAFTCVRPIWAQNCPVPTVPTFFLTLMPPLALWQAGTSLWSLDPI